MEISDFKVGQRVRIHPASDWFMRGVVYATVIQLPILKTREAGIKVKAESFDVSFWIHPRYILEIVE
jgi:hypothetical protein